MQEQQTYQPNVEIATRLFMSVLDESGSVLKLHFTLSTGAVVLFVNVLAASHAGRLVLVPLVLSIYAFGIAALLYLGLLWSLVSFRKILTDAVLKGITAQAVKQQLDKWDTETEEKAKWAKRMFAAGMVLAGIFVIAIFVVRP